MRESNQLDYAVFELGQMQLKLRADLKFSFREAGDRGYYVVEDVANGKFYRIGVAEYVFVSFLDGRTTVQSALAATAAKLGSEAFCEHEATTICRWLVEADLIDVKRHDVQKWNEVQERRRMAKRLQWINPLMLRIPLGNPGRMVEALERCFGWLFHPLFLSLWLLVCGAAFVFTLSAGDRLWLNQRPILARENWIWLALGWVALRALHEAAHAIACQRFGGCVRQWGILLLMLIPLPYVDVTTSWRFPGRWERVLTAAAGMMAELFVAAIAAIVWYCSDDSFLRQHAMNLMVAASVTTLVFNANPLMRFDGYHILADCLDTPNLWTHSWQFVRSLGRRIFFGLPSSPPSWAPRKRWLIQSYGCLAAIWKVLVLSSLLVGAANLLDGVGLLLALLGGLLWIGLPCVKLVRFVLFRSETETPDRRRFFLVSGSLVSIIVFFLALPLQRTIRAPVFIRHEPFTVVRAQASGFVRSISVRSGESVTAGDVIALLSNEDLEGDIQQVRLELQSSARQLQSLQIKGDISAMQIEQENRHDLQNRLKELTALRGELRISAPTDGVVLDSNLEELLGIYVNRGRELMTIGGQDARKAIGLVTHETANHLRGLTPATVTVRIFGETGRPVAGWLSKISPRADTVLPHFSLAAVNGGEFAVVAGDSSAVGKEDAQSWILAEPHVQFEIDLSDPRLATTLTGQTGTAFIHGGTQSLWRNLTAKLHRLMRARLIRSHGI